MAESRFCNSFDITVAESDAVNSHCIVRAIYVNHIAALLAGNILYCDVFEIQRERSFGNTAVAELDSKDCKVALTNGDVACIHILNTATSLRIGLDADDALEMRGIHLTVLYPKILETTGNLASYGNTGVAVSHDAVAYDDVA